LPREIQLIGHPGQVRQSGCFHVSDDLAAMTFTRNSVIAFSFSMLSTSFLPQGR